MPSLKSYNSFGLDVSCSQLARIKKNSDLSSFLNLDSNASFILGGGSNILLLNDLNKVVLKNEIKGKDIVKETAKHIFVRVGGGENWHNFVKWCIQRGYGGVENLSLIPGSVGASPMQNIGAYGVEIKDVFHSLEAIDLKTGRAKNFSKSSCQFGYRTSVFKTSLKGKYFISNVTFKLSKSPEFNLGYGAILNELDRLKVTKPSLKTVSKAIINIRNSKLPDPKLIGNAGSFFKNPIVSSKKCNQLLANFPNMPAYSNVPYRKKLSAGWLIQQTGWKGKAHKGAACYKNHALILINNKNAKGTDILELAEKIQKSVIDKFGVELSPEVNLIS